MSACPRCGTEVACGMNNPDQACWCTAYPAVLPVPEAGAASCYCPQCLQAIIREQAALREAAATSGGK
ncbi:MAG: cysteine-rich CWC family protein [Burkholderiales bacterium]|nr:cysteine-rich CWC family protein [Burkholderiales bacterium]